MSQTVDQLGQPAADLGGRIEADATAGSSEPSGRNTVEVTSSRPKSLLANGLWSILLTVWTTGVTFFLTPFLIGRIGTDHYGLFILLMSISGMMGLLNLGLGEATLRYVAYYYGRNDMEGINRVVGATFSVYLVTGLIGWATLFFGADWITGLLAMSPADRELGASLLRLTAFSFGMSFVSGAFASIPQALQRFDISTKISIAQNIFHVAGTVTVLFMGLGIYELVMWSVATAIFTQVVNTVAARQLIPALHIRPRPTRAGLREVFGYGVFSCVTSILAIIWGQADRLLLGVFIGPASIAYLTVPQQVAFRGVGMVTSASSALMPRLTTLSDMKLTQRLFLDATWTTLCMSVLIFVPVTALFPDLLRLWIGTEFAQKSAWIGQVIGCGCIVRGAFLPYMALFAAIGKPQYQTMQSTVSAIVSLGVNIALIPILGLNGAGYAYLATVFVGLATVCVTWRVILRSPALWQLLNAVGFPIIAGFVALLCTTYLHVMCPVTGWLSLAGVAAMSTILTGALLAVADWLGSSSTTAMRTARLMRHVTIESGIHSGDEL